MSYKILMRDQLDEHPLHEIIMYEIPATGTYYVAMCGRIRLTTKSVTAAESYYCRKLACGL